MSSTHVHLTIEWYVPIGQARPTTLALIPSRPRLG